MATVRLTDGVKHQLRERLKETFSSSNEQLNSAKYQISSNKTAFKTLVDMRCEREFALVNELKALNGDWVRSLSSTPTASIFGGRDPSLYLPAEVIAALNKSYSNNEREGGYELNKRINDLSAPSVTIACAFVFDIPSNRSRFDLTQWEAESLFGPEPVRAVFETREASGYEAATGMLALINLNTLMNQAGSVNQLVKLWPEIKTLLPREIITRLAVKVATSRTQAPDPEAAAGHIGAINQALSLKKLENSI